MRTSENYPSTIQAWNGARSCVAASARVRELEEVEARLAALERGAKGREAGRAYGGVYEP